jgi:phasin
VIPFDDQPSLRPVAVLQGHTDSPDAKGFPMTSSTDPFSASVIPFQVPEQMRALAEKGVSQARDSYTKFKDAAETHNGTIEAVFGSVSKGASEYSAKMLEFMQTNTTAALDFAQELVAVKSLPQAGEIWTGYTRKQFETLTAQAKELAELSKKIATETAEPIKAGASKIFTPAA